MFKIKIISTSEYNNLINEIKTYQDMYSELENQSMIREKDNDLKIQYISDRLVDILNYNSKTKKEVILGQVKGLLKYIRKGKVE